MRRFLGIVALLAAASAMLPAQSNADPTTYTGQVQPLFQAKCYGCHAGKQQMGGLRLDAKSLAFGGGQSGVPGVVPGKPEANSAIVAMPLVVALRPVSSDARVGEQRAVVWKLAYRSPPAAKRSKVGVSRSDPKHPSWA